MKIAIETASNGFIIHAPLDDGDGDQLIVVASDDPAEASRNMLWEVLELIGHVGSRYDEHRVQVVIEHGDKWMSPEDWAKELAHEAPHD